MSPRMNLFNFGKIKHPAKFNYSFFPYHDYGDRLDGITMQPRSSIMKIAMATNLSETISNDALSHEFVTPTEVLQSTSNKASMIAVLVIMAVFLIITISTTSLLLAFCRKKNTVFALQKCEEQDSEYELDDIEQTDIEMLKEETSRSHSIKSRSETCPSFTQLSRESSGSPTNQPLMRDSSPKLTTKKSVNRNNVSRMPRSKTFTCSVYYNAKSDHQTPVYSNILQMDSYDEYSPENVYCGERLENVIVNNASLTDSEKTVPNKHDFLDNSTVKTSSFNETKNVQTLITPKQDFLGTLYNPNCNESRMNVLNPKSSKQDYVLDSSLQKPSCCTNTADLNLQPQRETTPFDTIDVCATTFAKKDNVTVSDCNKVRHFEDAILVDVCSGNCTRNYDSAVKSDMFVQQRLDNSPGDECKTNYNSAIKSNVVLKPRTDKSLGNVCSPTVNTDMFVKPRADNSLGDRGTTNYNSAVNTDMFVKSRGNTSLGDRYTTNYTSAENTKVVVNPRVDNSNIDTSGIRRRNSDISISNTENTPW